MIDNLSAGARWAQGEMWEPLGNVVPLPPKYEILASHARVDWGYRDGQHYFRVKGQRAWYLDISMPHDIARQVARGRLADNLPGAYRPVDKRGK